MKTKIKITVWTIINLAVLAASSAAYTTNYFVNFEGQGETKPGYASGTVTLSGIDWNLTEVLIGTDATTERMALAQPACGQTM
jgi:hypothetical protein